MTSVSSGDLPFVLFGLIVGVLTLVEVLVRRDGSVFRGLALRHIPAAVYRPLMGGSAVFILLWSIGGLADLSVVQAIGIWGAAGCLAVLLMVEAAYWVADQPDSDLDE